MHYDVSVAVEESVRCPNHIVINCRNRYFKAVPFERDGSPWSAGKLERFLCHLVGKVEQDDAAEGLEIGTLTCADRDRWAEVGL